MKFLGWTLSLIGLTMALYGAFTGDIELNHTGGITQLFGLNVLLCLDVIKLKQQIK
ncbi:hypothetical protein MKY89_26105 [Bacillus sp. FSL W7-1294]|uniref:hypothetical protein n=1 Tax=Bacillus TaxID=1386 RepID=UPI000A490A88|nr:hypothetical protein [Bacillus cereus]